MIELTKNYKPTSKKEVILIPMIPYKQLSLADIFQDCQENFESDKPAFLSLLEEHIDIDEIIPLSFRNHFYASTGRTRKYPLQAFLWALIIQRIFSRAKLENPDYRLNADGIPCCPHDETLPMKYEGTSKLKSGVTRYKFVCPKIKWEKTANTGKYKTILESFYPPPPYFLSIFSG